MKSIFPASYSTLCPDALASLISEKYGIFAVECRLLVRGVGDTYLVTAENDRFILRVYRSSHRSLAQISEEVKLLVSLKQAGVSVSYPISDINNQTIQHIEAIEGLRYAVLFTYASGTVIKQLSKTQLLNLGREMARFHNVSENSKKGDSRWEFDVKTTVLEPLKVINIPDIEDYNWLAETADRLQAVLSDFPTERFPKGYCHFDFLPKNFHFEEDKVTFFDFDFMGYGFLVNDVMTFWQHLALEVYTVRMKRTEADESYRIFLEGYRECRPISDEELALVPYLAPGFWLFYMGFHTTHDQFSVFTQAPHVKSYLGILKHIVNTYWNK